MLLSTVGKTLNIRDSSTFPWTPWPTLWTAGLVCVLIVLALVGMLYVLQRGGGVRGALVLLGLAAPLAACGFFELARLSMWIFVVCIHPFSFEDGTPEPGYVFGLENVLVTHGMALLALMVAGILFMAALIMVARGRAGRGKV